MKEKKDKKEPELYTQTEKIKQCIELKKQIKELGLDIYTDEIKELDSIIQNYVKDNIEYIGEIKLPGAKRIMEIKFRNKKKWDITVNLKYNENI